MLAYVYKSLKKADTYLYLAKRDDFAGLPEPLRTQLGSLQFVLEVELTPERRLARENPEVVRDKRVLVVEDGPTLTHGEMRFGAGIMAAERYGAAELVS